MSPRYHDEATALREVAEWMSSIGPGEYRGCDLATDARDYAAWLREFADAMQGFAQREAMRLRAIAVALDNLTSAQATYVIPTNWSARLLYGSAYLVAVADYLDCRTAAPTGDVTVVVARELARIVRGGGRECV